MGLVGNIRDKLGNKIQEVKENRARDKAEYQEHYKREYEIMRKKEIEKSAREKAHQDAYAHAHPIENIRERLGGLGGDIKKTSSGGRNLNRTLSGLGDFGRSIGKSYNNMKPPSYLRDFDKPIKKHSRKRTIIIKL